MRTSLLTLLVLVLAVSIIPAGGLGLQASVQDRGETSVTIRWDAAPPGFQGYYKVWRADVDATGNSSGSRVVYTSTDLTKTVYTDLGLNPGGHYRYTVQLYDALDRLVGQDAVDACTQRKEPAINWGMVAGGVLVILLLVLVFKFGGAELLGHPAGIAAVVAILGLGFGLMGFGLSATTLVSPC